MPGGLDDLAKRLRAHGEVIPVNLNKKTRRVAMAIDTLIVKAMPIDVGRAKSAVVVTVGEASFAETKEAYFPGKKGSTEGENIRAAIDQAESALKDRQLGEEIHININIPYIDALNRGHSPLASPGFIQQAIVDGVSTESGVSILEK